jgi:hypothetical protein
MLLDVSQETMITAQTLAPSSVPCLDERLEALVLRRIGNRVRELRVLVRRDGIVLQGRAPTYHAKQLAQHAAMELLSLPIAANEIEVC